MCVCTGEKGDGRMSTDMKNLDSGFNTFYIDFWKTETKK